MAVSPGYSGISSLAGRGILASTCICPGRTKVNFIVLAEAIPVLRFAQQRRRALVWRFIFFFLHNAFQKESSFHNWPLSFRAVPHCLFKVQVSFFQSSFGLFFPGSASLFSSYRLVFGQ